MCTASRIFLIDVPPSMRTRPERYQAGRESLLYGRYYPGVGTVKPTDCG
jgi:hypothetical protein